MPATTVRVQRRACWLCLLGATHFLPTLRPPSERVNRSVTVAASLSSKENLVPIGRPFVLVLTCASAVLSRQVLAVSLRVLRVSLKGTDDTDVLPNDVPTGNFTLTLGSFRLGMPTAGTAGTVTVAVCSAPLEPLQLAVCPVK